MSEQLLSCFFPPHTLQAPPLLTTVSPLSPCSPAPGAPRCTRCPAAQLRNNTPPLPWCAPRPCVSWSGGWRWCSAAQRDWDPPSGDCSTCPMCWHCTSMFMYVCMYYSALQTFNCVYYVRVLFVFVCMYSTLTYVGVRGRVL